MNKAFFAAQAAVLVILVSCTSAPDTPQPEWVLRINSVYPRETYLAQQGRGKTKAEAQSMGSAALSSFIQQEVSVESSRRISILTEGDVTSETRQTGEAVTVKTEESLRFVRYSEDTWFDKGTREYVIVAYIERDEAWKDFYESQSKRAAEALLALYGTAEKERDPFTSVRRYAGVRSYANGDEFGKPRSFAQVIYPSKADALFAEADAAVSALPERIKTARQAASLFIDCPADLDSLIANAAAAAFGAAGFPVAKSRGAASSVCVIRVDEGKQSGETGTSYSPALSGTVTSSGTAVFSFTAKAARQSAVNPDVAKRRAYTALAEALKKALPEQLEQETK